jgi:hypothetical protein
MGDESGSLFTTPEGWALPLNRFEQLLELQLERRVHGLRCPHDTYAFNRREAGFGSPDFDGSLVGIN